MIHETAIIDPSAKIAKNASIGAYSSIGKDGEIGPGTIIESNVVIHKNSKLGKDNHIYPFASIGGDPQDLKYEDEETFLKIGNNNQIREGVTINRGTAQEKGLTSIGNNNLFMAYSHVAHDCTLDDDIVLVNNVALAGVVNIAKGARLGGYTLVHQFCNIGPYSFCAMGSAVSKDIPAFVRVSGNPAIPRGLNVIGIQRLDLGKDQSSLLKKFYKLVYLRKLKLDQAISEIEKEVSDFDEGKLFLDSIQSSDRGIVR